MFQNLDLNPKKFFINHDYSRLVTDICELKDQQLIKNLYYYPSLQVPLEYYIGTSSVFKEYTIPTASHKFYPTDRGFRCDSVDKDITLDYYVDQVDQTIRQNIQQIYQDNDTVTLCYSGGIDSIVILSYIMSLDLLSKTDIVCFKNLTQERKNIDVELAKEEKVLALLDQIRSECNGITWLTVTQDDFVYAVKNLDFRHAQCYVTSKLLRQYNNRAFVFGFHGNQILLHKNIFIDEIIKVRPGARAEFLNSTKDYYAQGMTNYVPPEHSPGIEYTHMMMRPWAELDNYQGNRVYGPIGSDLAFNLLRQLDYSAIPVDVVTNALVARELINRNSRSLAEYITTESLHDLDSFKFAKNFVSLLDLEKLNIPTNLNHDPDGLAYLTDALKKSIYSKNIEISILMSVRALQWISSRF